MLTISRLGHRSVKYYNDTASQANRSAAKRQTAGGGLAEYYSEGETRLPNWLVVGDKQFLAQATGLGGSALDGGNADTEHARVWLDDGRAPNEVAGREFTEKSVHGFDLTFSAPKSVSLIRALTDDIAEKVLATAHTQAVHAAMEYLHHHAGYTRVHNPITGNKDLQRLPGGWLTQNRDTASSCADSVPPLGLEPRPCGF
jgi:conjugative relaxase-like TrwC/TraI family protein